MSRRCLGKTIRVCFFVVLDLLVYTSTLSAESANFFFQWNEDGVGAAPAGWGCYATGRGAPGKWEIFLDGDNKVLGQLASGGFGYLLRSLVWEARTFQDVELAVKVKAVSGGVEQGGGLVWRLQDAGNYYVSRINPLEGDFRLYKVVDGKRKLLARVELALAQGRWYHLAIRMVADRIEGHLAGRKYFEIVDSALPHWGLVGVWTKVDAVTYFDDFMVSGKAENPPLPVRK